MTFDLDNNVYKPFGRENNKPIYINKHSNHPPSILKQLPKSIEKRISKTSSTFYFIFLGKINIIYAWQLVTHETQSITVDETVDGTMKPVP